MAQPASNGLLSVWKNINGNQALFKITTMTHLVLCHGTWTNTNPAALSIHQTVRVFEIYACSLSHLELDEKLNANLMTVY